MLIGVLTSSAIFFSYDKGNEVQAVAGVDDIAIAGLVTAILMSYGYVTLDYYNNTDGANALADDWEEAYEQARFKVLNGGGSGDDGDDDNDDDDFEDTDGDGKITEKDIPKFNQLYSPTSGVAAGTATFLITANAGKLLAPIISKFIYSKFGKNNWKSEKMLSYLKSGRTELNNFIENNAIDVSQYPNHFSYHDYRATGNGPVFNTIYYYYSKSGYKITGEDSLSVVIRDGLLIAVDLLNDEISCKEINKANSISQWFRNDLYSYYFCDLPEKNTSDIPWSSPSIGDGFDTKGNLELLPPPHLTNLESYNMPGQQALQNLLNSMNNPEISPDAQQQLLVDFINNLANKKNTDSSTDPDKDPDKDPSTDPDKDPDKDPSTDPDKNPDKDPSTDPDNDPDKDPSTDPDKNPDKDPSTDPDNESFLADLKELFPFCIPFDIVDCFKLFSAEPETPRVEFPIHFGIVDKDYTFVMDLKDFNDVAKVCRTSFLVLFMVGLGFATSRLIKW